MDFILPPGGEQNPDTALAAGTIADNAVVRGDGGSKGIQGSGVLIDDSDNVTGVETVRIDGAAPRITLDTSDSGTNYAQILQTSSGSSFYSQQVISAAVPVFYDIALLPGDGTSAATVRMFRFTNTTGVRRIDIHSGDGTTNLDHRISCGGADSYFQAGGGNFGIGTTNPVNKLTVLGDLSNPVGFYRDFDASTATAAVSVSMGALDGTAQTAGAQITAALNATGANNTGEFRIYVLDTSGVMTEMVRVEETGNVGIGTSSPSTKLDVAGPIRCASYTVGTAPSASGIAGARIHVTDDVGGPTDASSDGTDWRRYEDKAVITT